MKGIYLRITVLIITLTTLFNLLAAQQQRCGTPPPPAVWENWFSQKVQEYKTSLLANKATVTNTVIPVVVHVIHDGQPVGTSSNISALQIQSQITVLNEDFGATNADLANVPAVFQSVLSGNTGVQFCLAAVDTNNNLLAEAGIHRVPYTAINGLASPGAGYSNSTVDNVIKPATIWDPHKYLNIWVADLSGGLPGYANFPAGTTLAGFPSTETATTSGIVIDPNFFGTTGTVAAPYDKGRTTTHEVAHWLGLRHIWGDSNCGTDYCNDTPAAQQAHYGCPTHPNNVGVCAGNTNGEMFMNFLDYSNDACLIMFTADQAIRIQTAMTTGTFRSSLAYSSACQVPGPPVAAFLIGSNPVCKDDLISFTDVTSQNPNSWQWDFGDGSTSSIQNPTHVFSSAGVFTVTLIAANALGNDTNSVAVTVNNSPVVSVNGPFTICEGDSVTLIAGGASSYTWNTGHTADTITLTTFFSLQAIVTGTDSLGCTGTDTTTIFTNPDTWIGGNVTFSGGTVDSGAVFLIASGLSSSLFDTLMISPIAPGGYFTFGAVPPGNYYLRAEADTNYSSSYSLLTASYYNNAFLWDSATVINHGCFTSDSVNIVMVEMSQIGAGGGSISGNINSGSGFGNKLNFSAANAVANGIPGVPVKLATYPAGQPVAQTVTDANGAYSFSNLPSNVYSVLTDLIGYPMNNVIQVTISGPNDSIQNVNYIADSNAVYIDLSTSTTEFNSDQLEVMAFPNPADEVVIVSFTADDHEPVLMEIFDMQGKSLKKISLSPNEQNQHVHHINTTEIPAGIYLLKVKSGIQNTMLRLAVIR